MNELPPVPGVLIAVDGSVSVLPDTEFFTMKAAIGGWLEVAPSASSILLWCDEDGKGKGLTLNYRANDLWSMVDVFHCMEAGDRLVGPVVVTGGDDGNGETTAVPPWVLEHLGVVRQT
jgi:hypothetical protein